MNKADLIAAIAKDAKISKADAEKIIANAPKHLSDKWEVELLESPPEPDYPDEPEYE